MQSDASLLARVSKVFTLMDRGDLHKEKGGSLRSIEVLPDEALLDMPGSSEEDEPAASSKPQRKKKRSESDDDYVPMKNTNKVTSTKKKKSYSNRKPWGTDEKEAVVRHLQKFVASGTYPGKKDCEACIEKESALSGRTWLQVKAYIKNEVTKKKTLKSVSPLKLRFNN